MDLHTMTQSLVALAEDNMAFFSSQGPGETARRLSAVFAGIREQALGLETPLANLLGTAHLYDLDADTPANGYRSLVHTARCCLAHLLHKSRYVASNRRSIFFRTHHNLAELEAYLAAITQLRALAYYAQQLLTTNQTGGLFFEGEEEVLAEFLREYVRLHKGCFYGRCLGFQVSPLQHSPGAAGTLPASSPAPLDHLTEPVSLGLGERHMSRGKVIWLSGQPHGPQTHRLTWNQKWVISLALEGSVQALTLVVTPLMTS